MRFSKFCSVIGILLLSVQISVYSVEVMVDYKPVNGSELLSSSHKSHKENIKKIVEKFGDDFRIQFLSENPRYILIEFYNANKIASFKRFRAVCNTMKSMSTEDRLQPKTRESKRKILEQEGLVLLRDAGYSPEPSFSLKLEDIPVYENSLTLVEYYKGIEIRFSPAVIHLINEKEASIHFSTIGMQNPKISATAPKIPLDKTIERYLSQKKFYHFYKKPKGSLIYITDKKALFPKLILCWVIEIDARPEPMTVFIDAETGEVLSEESQLKRGCSAE